MNNDIMNKCGFFNEVKDVKNNICPVCKKTVNTFEFKDVISFKEFKISGLCQKCQDRIFK